jgi:penicillin V acylase-like amidase (Ntn superfamily)
MAWVVAFAGAFVPASATACSVFCVERGGEVIVARNQDWPFDEGILVVNKRGHAKSALAYRGESTENLATWTARYGSITLVQYGRDVDFAGVNEAGLVVHQQWLDGTRYPPADARPSVSVDQFQQYLLDNFRSVDEVIASDAAVRVRPNPAGSTLQHFFVVDATGVAAVLEFRNGRMVIHAHDALPAKALTNDGYAESLASLPPRGSPLPTGYGSLARFGRAAAYAAGDSPTDGVDPITSAFATLDDLRQWNTRFQTVFDAKRRVVYFRSSRVPAVRSVRMEALDFSCATPALVIDLASPGAGDVTTRLAPYTTAENERLIARAWNAHGYYDFEKRALQAISRYPETFRCASRDGVAPGTAPSPAAARQ